jgi:raffinose/stachyose/melibiose transport system permease protein
MSGRLKVSAGQATSAEIKEPAQRAMRSGAELMGWLYITPSLLINLVFLLFPVVATLLLAFTTWNGLENPSWTGFTNFVEIFASLPFWQALVNNGKWTVIFLTVPIGLALVAAAALFQARRLRFLQTIFLIPYILPTVLQARIWQGMIFNPETGVFGWLSKHGISIPDPLINTDTSLYGIALVNLWAWWGFLTVIFLAAFRQIDKELLDAARVEGAGFWSRLFRIQIPLIKPTLLFMLIMTFVWSFLIFDYVYVLTDGGPAGSSEVLSTLAYRYGFERFEFGKAAAISAFAGLLGMVAILFYIWLQKRGVEQ